MGTTLIDVRKLCKSYGEHLVLKDVTFDVEDGEGFAIIGPNGAGKTTLFKTLTGEVPASNGSIHFGDHDITLLPAHERVRMGFGRTFQVARVFLDDTSVQNLIVTIEARRSQQALSNGNWYSWRPSAEVLEEACFRLAAIGLYDKRLIEARNLSHGDKKRLELAICLAGEPKVLMLDEPTAGMSPGERQQIVELIQHIRRDLGITVMLTEHDMNVVFGIADRVLVLNYGEIVALGSPSDIRSDPMVSEIYFGKEMIDA
jgi:branched-chain amino acid transport system ATP-binding protein